jgi:hypothetical protein
MYVVDRFSGKETGFVGKMMSDYCVQWDDRKARGLFHHDITACETKVLHSSLINYPEIFFLAKF